MRKKCMKHLCKTGYVKVIFFLSYTFQDDAFANDLNFLKVKFKSSMIFIDIFFIIVKCELNVQPKYFTSLV